jgi:hypothetical protein
MPMIPLRVKRCDNCAAVQLAETVNPEFLFSKYVWVTGTSPTTRNYSNIFYGEAMRRINPKNKKLFVVEIASNDGTFLRPFKNGGHKILGIDPAKNIAKEANKNGITTSAEFFGLPVAKKIVSKNGNADFVFARNVIPHVENVHDVIAGMAECLSPDGMGVIEFHYSKVILDELHYDSIYHEHYLYHSLKTMRYLLNRHGLIPFDVMESPISGGSLVLYFSKKERPATPILKRKYREEASSRVNTLGAWRNFAKKAGQHRVALNKVINEKTRMGSKMIGFGASARSSTMLNYCRISNAKLGCIADNNPIKQNKYTPGSNIRIVAPKKAFSLKPDSVLLLAWNFKDEIISDIRNKFSFKGKIILPLPNSVRVI